MGTVAKKTLTKEIKKTNAYVSILIMTSSIFYNIGIIFFKQFTLQSYVLVVLDMVLSMVCIKIYSVQSSKT